jgi:hypothetical protein
MPARAVYCVSFRLANQEKSAARWRRYSARAAARGSATALLRCKETPQPQFVADPARDREPEPGERGRVRLQAVQQVGFGRTPTHMHGRGMAADLYDRSGSNQIRLKPCKKQVDVRASTQITQGRAGHDGLINAGERRSPEPGFQVRLCRQYQQTDSSP